MLGKRFMLAVAVGSTAGCAVTPAAPPAPSRAAPERSVQATAVARMPTLEEMKKLIPSRLTAQEAAKSLVRFPQSKIFLPKPSRKTQNIFGLGMGGRGFGGLGYGGLGLGLGISPFYSSILANPLSGIYGFHPFSYLGGDFWAPFMYNPLALAYTPFAYASPLISAYPYFASPFIGSLGCGIAPATLALTSLGCGGLGLGGALGLGGGLGLI